MAVSGKKDDHQIKKEAFHKDDEFVCSTSTELESFESSTLSWKPPDFVSPGTLTTFIYAIKKNRSCQIFIQNKLLELKARIEESKVLKERIQTLQNFHFSCKTRPEWASFVNTDANAKLVSARNAKVNGKNHLALSYGPVENSDVASYRKVVLDYPFSQNRQKWSKKDKEYLCKGIEQQFQEIVLQNSLGSSASFRNVDTFDNTAASFTDIEVIPANIRSFLHMVDWQRLASLYLPGRSGVECEARWLNCGDPLINQDLWSKAEDMKLITITQNRGPYNWIEIATALGSNRTPFQCLARYQRSLNSQIMKQEWTAEDDAQLCEAVDTYGEQDWQQVASKLERRTAIQCSNRWTKTLCPARERVGRWTVEEDQHLKISVMLFGAKNWQKIAKFVFGRTQVQCRERWVNVLDPSLNLLEWTEEEDAKLKAAIAEHGHCWSKVAASVTPRTDNQCRRRWKILLPHEVPLLQSVRRIQKSSMASNFVDRQAERPALAHSDFLALSRAYDVAEVKKENCTKKRNMSSDILPIEVSSQMSPDDAQKNCRKVSVMLNDDPGEPSVWNTSLSKYRKLRKLQSRRKRCSDREHVFTQDPPMSPQPPASGEDVWTAVNNVTSSKKIDVSFLERDECVGPTKNSKGESMSSDYLKLSVTDAANANKNCWGFELRKRRKLSAKRNEGSNAADSCQQGSLSPKLTVESHSEKCECGLPEQEHLVMSLPQTETLSPPKMKQVLQENLMGPLHSHGTFWSECDEKQNSLTQSSHYTHTDNREHQISAASQSLVYETIDNPGLSMAYQSLDDYFPCPESIVEAPSDPIYFHEQDGRNIFCDNS